MADIEGLWWQFSLSERSQKEPSAVSLLRISRDRDGVLEVRGRSWQEDGRLSARYWSEAAKERKEPSGVFYYWNGERPLDPNSPRLEGNGEIRLEFADRAAGYWTTRSDARQKVNARTSGIYVRAASEDLENPRWLRQLTTREIDRRQAEPLEGDHGHLSRARLFQSRQGLMSGG